MALSLNNLAAAIKFQAIISSPPGAAIAVKRRPAAGKNVTLAM